MNADVGHHHVIPLRVFGYVFFSLIVLTLVTVAAAQVDFGMFNFVVAMGIASLKAFLVLSYFMHLKYDDKLFVVLFFLSVFFLLVMYSFIAVDLGTRIFQESTL